MTVDYYTLRPDYSISRIIKGGWQLSGDHGAVDRQVAIEDMLQFVDAGIITFDCADIYTGVEEMLGEFVDLVRRERGEETLSQIKIHTKFVPDYAKLGAVGHDYVTAIIDRSLRRLHLRQLNLVQFHWWDYELPGYLDTLQILEELRQQGKIDQLSVTNFDAAHIEDIAAAGIELISAQIQYSLLDQRPANEFTAICQQHNIHLLCYGVLAGGFISEQWLGQADPGYEFENRSLVKYRLIIDEFGGWDLFQALLQKLANVGQKHQVNLSTVAMRYILDKPQVAAVIIGARYARYLKDTLRVFELTLDSADMRSINAVLEQSQGPGGSVYGLERDRHGRHGRIMKYNLNK